MSGVLRISHPRLRRGRHVVLPATEFTIPAGVTLGVAGVNGSGKSTLFMALAGTLRPSRAEIESVSAGTLERIRVSYAPQLPALPDWLRVSEALHLFGVDGDTVVERMPGLLLGEVLHARVSQLSGGQRQIIGVAAALAVPSDAVLLDEPFAALDMRRRRGLMDLLEAVRIETPQRTVIVSSQVAADLFDLATWLIVLADGRYAFRGTRAELLQRDAKGDALTFERRLFAVMDGAPMSSTTSVAAPNDDRAISTDSSTANRSAATSDPAEHP